MNKKFSITLLSFIIAVILFVVLVAIEKKVQNPNGLAKVYYVKTKIDKNTTFDKTNIDKYFILKDIGKDLVVKGAITNKNDLINTFATDDLLEGEQISSSRICSVSKKLDDIQNKVEYSVKFSDIGEVVGGTLKQGDMIDIILTEKKSGENKTITQTQLKNVLIDKAFTADGTQIDRANSDGKKLSAVTLNLVLSATDAHKLDNAIARGKIKVLKKLDNSTYNDITIENDN